MSLRFIDGRAAVSISVRFLVAAFALFAAAAGCGDLNDRLGTQDIAYAPDGTLIAFTVADIRHFDGQLKGEINAPVFAGLGPTHDFLANSFAVSADGTTAALEYAQISATGTNRGVRIFQLPAGTILNDIPLDVAPTSAQSAIVDVGSAAISPGGDLVFAQNSAQLPEADTAMFRVADGARLWSAGWLSEALFSVDGATLYAIRNGANDPPNVFELVAFDALTGAMKFSVNAGVDAIRLVADGSIIAGEQGLVMGSSDESSQTPVLGIGFWSAADGTPLSTYPTFDYSGLTGSQGHGTEPFACWRSGNLCATATVGTAGNQILIWDTAGSLVQRIAVPRANLGLGFGFANDLSFSPDGRFVALAGDTTRVYQVSDGALVAERTLRAHLF